MKCNYDEPTLIQLQRTSYSPSTGQLALTLVNPRPQLALTLVNPRPGQCTAIAMFYSWTTFSVQWMRTQAPCFTLALTLPLTPAHS